MTAIKQWFVSKGGLAHLLAASFAFLMLAYGAVPQFHAFVLSIHQELPGWLQELATTVLALWAFYKEWRAHGTVQSSSSTTATKAILLVLGISCLCGMSGCKTVTASTPPAPGYVTIGEENVGKVIAAADGIVLKYEADVQSGAYKPVPAVTAAVSTIQQALAVADPLALAWHQALLANAASTEPAALATAVSTITANITKIPGSVQ